MNDFLSIAVLGSFAGVILFVTIFTEITKFIVKIKIDPKWYVLFWSVVWMAVRSLLVIPCTTPQMWVEAALNVGVVFASAIGLFETAGKPIERSVLQAIEAKQQLYSTTDEVGDEDGE